MVQSISSSDHNIYSGKPRHAQDLMVGSIAISESRSGSAYGIVIHPQKALDIVGEPSLFRARVSQESISISEGMALKGGKYAYAVADLRGDEDLESAITWHDFEQRDAVLPLSMLGAVITTRSAARSEIGSELAVGQDYTKALSATRDFFCGHYKQIVVEDPLPDSLIAILGHAPTVQMLRRLGFEDGVLP